MPGNPAADDLPRSHKDVLTGFEIDMMNAWAEELDNVSPACVPTMICDLDAHLWDMERVEAFFDEHGDKELDEVRVDLGLDPYIPERVANYTEGDSDES
ncbi:MAG: hypothetical protein ACOCR6_00550 [archaeon]